MAMLRELPRAGISLTWRDLASAVRYVFTSNSQFPTIFACWLHAERIWTVSSGRAALYLILRTLAECSSRREVVIPAYTCPTVPLAVARSGLHVRLCDVDPATGNLNAQRLEESGGTETLAVVPVHMHGIPCDMRVILGVAKERGMFVVEDCAQAAGAAMDGRRVGTFGDAAFFSLGRGKGFTAYEGGIGWIADRGLLSADCTRHVAECKVPSRRSQVAEGVIEALTIAKLVGMAVFFHPHLHWMIRLLPLGWNNEVYSEDFAIGKIGRFREGVALSVLRRLDQVLGERREKAGYLQQRLRGVRDVQLLEPPAGSQPSYPWLPLLMENRDEAVRRLQARGLGAAWLFTRSLNQYEYLRDIVPQGSHPGAEYMAAHLLTLPTHEYVTRRDMDQMLHILTKVAQ